MIKVWGRTNSLNVQKPLLVLEELGLAYERTDAGLQFGVVNSPEYREMNPNGLVPTINDGDLILWESNAVVRYLCARYASGSFWAEDARERAAADKWMDWQQTVLLDPINDIFRPLIRKMWEPSPAEIEKALGRCEQNAAILDALLSGQPFISGQTLGMADFPVLTTVHRWMNLPIARKPRAHLERWYTDYMARPAARKILTTPIT